jgi:hypothetical protein
LGRPPQHRRVLGEVALDGQNAHGQLVSAHSNP